MNERGTVTGEPETVSQVFGASSCFGRAEVALRWGTTRGLHRLEKECPFAPANQRRLKQNAALW